MSTTIANAADVRPRSAASAAFAERFKYILCTSFLLTSSLSISFYSESHAYNQIDSLEAGDEDLGSVVQQQPQASTSSTSKSAAASTSFIRLADSLIRQDRVALRPPGQPRNENDKLDSSQELPRTMIRCPAEAFETPSYSIRVAIPAHARKHFSTPASTKPLQAILGPVLSPPGLILRNSTILATLILAPLSSSVALWFRTSLVLVCLSWTTVLVMGWHLGDASTFLSLQLEYPPSSSRAGLMDTPDSATESITTSTSVSTAAASQQGQAALSLPPSISTVGQLVIRRDAFHSALRLVRAAQRLDIELNRAIAAIQEVELVRRGYKLTYPLAPISRIESMPCTCMLHPSSPPVRQRTSVIMDAAAKDPSTAGRQSLPIATNSVAARSLNSPAVDRRVSTISSSTSSSSPPMSSLSRESQFSNSPNVNLANGAHSTSHRVGSSLRNGASANGTTANGRESLVSPHTSLGSQGTGEADNVPSHDQSDSKSFVADWSRTAAAAAAADGRWGTTSGGSQGSDPQPSRRISLLASYGLQPGQAQQSQTVPATCTCQRRQLLNLRRTLVDVLRTVGDEAGVTAGRLDPLVDEVELGLLLGMEGGNTGPDPIGAEIEGGAVSVDTVGGASSTSVPLPTMSSSQATSGSTDLPSFDEPPPAEITLAPGQVSLSDELALLAPSSFRGRGSTSTSSGDESPSGGSGVNSLQRAAEMAERRRAKRAGLRGAAPPSSFQGVHSGVNGTSSSSGSAPPVSFKPDQQLNSVQSTPASRPRNSRPGTAESEPGFSTWFRPDGSSGNNSSRHARRGSRLRYISDRPGSAMDQYSSSGFSPANLQQNQGSWGARRPGSASWSPAVGASGGGGAPAGIRTSVLSNYSGGLGGVHGDESHHVASAFGLASSSTATAAAATRALRRASASASASSLNSVAGRNILAQLRDAGIANASNDVGGSGAGLAPGARASRDSWTSGREGALAAMLAGGGAGADLPNGINTLGPKDNRETMRALEKLEGVFASPPLPQQQQRAAGAAALSLDELSPAQTDLDPYALISIRAGFQDMHRRRRDVLYRLLALEFESTGRHVLVRRLGSGGGARSDAGGDKSERPARWSKVNLTKMPTHNVALSTISYWSTVCRSMDAISSKMEKHAAEIVAQVAREMGTDGSGWDANADTEKTTAAVQRDDELEQSRERVLTDIFGPQTKEAPVLARASLAASSAAARDSKMLQEKLATEPALVENFQAMALALRTIQVKLHACSEDLGIQKGHALHGMEGSDGGNLGLGLGKRSTNSFEEIQRGLVEQARAERVFTGIREDLLAASSAWENGLKLMRQQTIRWQRARASMTSSGDGPAGSAAPGARVDEGSGEFAWDAVALSQRLSNFIEANGFMDGQSSTSHSQKSGPTSATAHPSARQQQQLAAAAAALSAQGNAAAQSMQDPHRPGEAEGDLAQLMLQQTSPAYLPAPGPEQLYEAEPRPAAYQNGGAQHGRKPTRDQHINAAERQLEVVNGLGVVNELKNVISQRHSYRAQGAASPATNGGSTTTGLGSPIQEGDSFASTVHQSSVPMLEIVDEPGKVSDSKLSPPMFGMTTKRKSRRVPDDPSAVFEMASSPSFPTHRETIHISSEDVAALRSRELEGRPLSVVTEDPWPVVEHDEMPPDAAASAAAAAAAAAARQRWAANGAVEEEHSYVSDADRFNLPSGVQPPRGALPAAQDQTHGQQWEAL